MEDLDGCNFVKFCARCNITKEKSEFGIRKSRPDGLYNYCKICKSKDDTKYRNKPEIKLKAKKYQKNYYKQNKENLDKNNIKYYYENYNKIRELQKQYNSKSEVKDRRNKLQKKRKQTDILFKIVHNLRNRINKIFSNKKIYKHSHFIEYIGCTVKELKIHLEKQFYNGMNFKNYGEWEIDHIIPLGIAKTEQEIYKLAHYINLKPLWHKDHIKKTINDNKLIKAVKNGE